MRLHHKDEGFTLIELMVVVLIIGILVAIAIPVFNSAKQNAQRKSCFANQRTFEGAARAYEAETGALPTGDFAAAAGTLTSGQKYLASVPKCPTGGTYVYTAADGTVWCGADGNETATGHGHYADYQAGTNLFK